MLKNYILSYSINKILLQHVEEINSDLNFALRVSIKKSNLDYIVDLFKVNFILERSTIFIYNISPANIVVSFFSKLFFNSKIIFHLHDPIPHSGMLNFFIFILQYVQVFLANTIFIYDNELKKDIKKYYFTKNKKIKILPHGKPVFQKENTSVNLSEINCGFFGRNMPYKNLDVYLEIVRKNPNVKFYIFGEGYDFVNIYQNLTILNRFIENNNYYSLMMDMDFIIIPYKDISFSGIISDSIALDKKIVVSDFVYCKYFNSNFIKIKDFIPQKNIANNLRQSQGWSDYAEVLKTYQIIKQIN